MHKPKVDIDPEFHTWIKDEAHKNKRNIPEQVELMLEMSKEQIESERINQDLHKVQEEG